MNLLCWNIRGIGNFDSKIALRNLCLSHNPGIIFLAEPIISSHIFREGNCCADMLANMGHTMQGSVWLDLFPAELYLDFFWDRVGLPNYRFP